MKKTDKKVIIFDTTLRDGEQCPGASMRLREKMEVARQLARLKVDVIEAGFPIASPGDFEAVQAIAKTIKGPEICGLSRCLDKDIDRAAEALEPAGRRGRIHVFLATSAIHRKYKLKKAKDEIIRQAVAGVQRAAKYVKSVQFSPEDAARTEPEFLVDVVRAAIEAGATTINIPDTVGYTVPEEFYRTISTLYEKVPGIDDITLHVHCHNDLGLAVANSLAAVRAGARGIECTINGIGERAGNCSLEEVVMAIQTRADALGGVHTGVESRELYRTSKLVSQLTGMMVQRNKAIVGANAFAHEAGIHQDGMLKNRQTYEIMRPEDVGISGTDLVLGKHSGRHAFADHLQKMGIHLKDKELQKAYENVILLADKKKTIYDDDIIAVIQDQVFDVPKVFRLNYLHVSSGTSTMPTATVRLDRSGEELSDAACGDGPVDAALRTIERITGVPGKLLDYTLQAITQGKDAQGEVTVRVDFGDEVISGKGSSTDVVEASAKAYLNCVNRYLFSRTAPKKKTAKKAAKKPAKKAAKKTAKKPAKKATKKVAKKKAGKRA